MQYRLVRRVSSRAVRVPGQPGLKLGLCYAANERTVQV